MREVYWMDRACKALYFLGMLAEIAIRLPHERGDAGGSAWRSTA